MSYVTPADVAPPLGLRDADNPRLERVCAAASAAIDDAIGNLPDATTGLVVELDPVPPMVREIALSLAIDLWKQPDATFGVVGLGDNGPIRMARDLLRRYEPQLIPFYTSSAWGVA